eukprot:TRINITY_DN5773_c0_g1_i1.p1 TRINITY_DN5773_c0_g1~~TRINITY_DN5773_c0_g1_i1.p1  ORF type:complete len:389 (+),score=73.68 TRINITY_DN5773_c0_g1_i1:119-1168(+)
MPTSLILLLSMTAVVTKDDVDNAFKVMNGFYDDRTGEWGRDKYGWWHESNIIETTVNYGDITGNTTTCLEMVSNTFDKTKTNFELKVRTAGYDDIGWSGLAWVQAYTISNKSNPGYLNRSIAAFNEMSTVWDDHCGGGLWWDRKKSYKNAITNELFLTLAMRLHSATGDDTYLNWGTRTWNWFYNSAMPSSNNLIRDGLQNDCTSTGEYYTYNQGVLLHGLSALYSVTKNETISKFALSTIGSVIANMTDENGILQEPADSSGDPGPDGLQFKGIFTRYLGYFLGECADCGSVVRSSKDFLVKNALSILRNDTNSEGQYGYLYQGPPEYTNYITHSSGFDTVAAAYARQ